MSIFTVSELSRLAHVTVRTLHHYDDIGLLRPAHRGRNGYRRYTEADLQRLQQILVFKELGFGLDAIAGIIDGPAATRRAALLTQRELLKGQLRQTEAVLRAIENAIKTLDGDTRMSSEKLFDGFDEFQNAEYAAEARERWGHTPAYQESERRTRQYRQQDWARIKAEEDAIVQRMLALMSAGTSPDSPEAMDLAEQHRRHIDHWFYPCSPTMHLGLGELYVSDARFTKYYDRHATGLAQFVTNAIKANAARAS
ncbi:MAG TPA: MerR family transcriptional regulator [Longimicrobiales bacterium]|nr:MerR family transcriptional regulator [Longimicrobiales bacterium]